MDEVPRINEQSVSLASSSFFLFFSRCNDISIGIYIYSVFHKGSGSSNYGFGIQALLRFVVHMWRYFRTCWCTSEIKMKVDRISWDIRSCTSISHLHK